MVFAPNQQPLPRRVAHRVGSYKRPQILMPL